MTDPGPDMALAAFSAAISDSFEASRAGLDEVRKFEAKLETSEPDAVYAEIVKGAERLVQKGISSSIDSAVLAFLETAEGRRLYKEYESRLDKAQRSSAAAEDKLADTEFRRAVRKQEVQRMIPWSEDDFAAARASEAVEKAESDLQNDAHGSIEAAARKLMQANPSLSLTRACALVVERNPDLYTAYVRKLEATQYRQTNPPLNTTSSNPANNGQLFGIDADNSGGEMDSGRSLVEKAHTRKKPGQFLPENWSDHVEASPWGISD